MLNQLILVGRILECIESNENEMNMIISVSRSFKEENGEYISDEIPVLIKGNICENAKKYCNKGDTVGVKGFIKSEKLEDGTYKTQLIADKMTFMSAKREEE